MTSPTSQRGARRHELLTGSAVSARRRLPPALAGWLEAEQRHVHRRVDRALLDPGTQSLLDEALRPEARATWLVPSVWLPGRALSVFGQPPPAFTRRRAGRTELLFVWHPEATPHVARLQSEPGPRFFGAVTSSSRTWLLWPADADEVEPFFAKLSLPLVVAGEHRTITAAQAQRSADVDALVSRLRSRLLFVREPLALVPHAAPQAGLIIRQVPKGRWRPFFALTDPRGRARLSLGTVKALLSRAVDGWLHAAIDLGLSLELHAQNLLIDGARFAFRDLDGVTADACFLERRWPRLAPLLEELRAHRTGVFDEPDQALVDGFFRFFLGGPAAGLGERLGSRTQGQALAIDALTRRLGVDASRPDEVLAEIHRRRALALRPPPPPRAIARYLASEHGPNARTRDPRFFAPVSFDALPSAWRPGPAALFALDAHELPAAEVKPLPRGVRPPKAFRAGGRLRLFVHPFMRGRMGLMEATSPLRPTPFFAAPTSSPRSLVVWGPDGEAFGLKLSLDVELLGLSRLVHTSKLQRALAVNACFDGISARTKRRIGFEVLREPFALDVPDRGDGQLVRALGSIVGEVVPGFSLFSPGGFLERVPRTALVEALRTLVFEPLAKVSAFLFFEEGLLGQLHQQNVLFHVGRGGVPDGRLVLRDLDSFKIDERVRRVRGRSLAPLRQANREALQLDEAVHGYDDAWARSCRADFGFLAEALLRRRGFSLGECREAVWGALDQSFLGAAAVHLGEGLIRRELDWALGRRGRSSKGRGRPISLILKEVAGARWSASDDRKTPRYSVNALVHALVAS